jgi:thiol-disulfide isomerase/thioredoxin
MTESVIKELTGDSDWLKVVDEPKKPVIIEFYASWCVPCQELIPIIARAAKEYPEITFFKYNVDKLYVRANGYNIEGIPSILMMKPNVTKETMLVFVRLRGFMSFPMLNEKIKEFLAASQD